MPFHKIEPTARTGDIEGDCSGDWTGGQIIDEVIIPKDLPSGEYVVGFRWDCEVSGLQHNSMPDDRYDFCCVC